MRRRGNRGDAYEMDADEMDADEMGSQGENICSRFNGFSIRFEEFKHEMCSLEPKSNLRDEPHFFQQ